MAKSFDVELATAAAVWNSFKMLREDAEEREWAAKQEHKEALARENSAFRKFLDLAERATLEQVDLHAQ